MERPHRTSAGLLHQTQVPDEDIGWLRTDRTVVSTEGDYNYICFRLIKSKFGTPFTIVKQLLIIIYKFRFNRTDIWAVG